MADFNLIEVTEQVDVNNLSDYQVSKAFIDTQVSTARAYPRDLNLCIKTVKDYIKSDKEFAEKCMYSLNKGGTIIKGPSVHLARFIGQTFGNMRLESKVIGIDSTHVTCEATCFDLEKNYAVRKTVKKSIVGSRGRYTEDMATIVANAASAIALRNAVFDVIPKPIVDSLYKTASETLVGDLSKKKDLERRKKKMFEGFLSKYKDKKLTQEEILKSINREKYEDVDSDDITTLIGYQNNISENPEAFETIFRQKNNEPSQPVDNLEKEKERLLSLMKNCKTVEELEKYKEHCTEPDQLNAYDDLYKSLK